MNADLVAVLVAGLVIAGAYLIGSVSFAVVMSRIFALPDPHTYGSKNPGATNVLRTGNKGLAAATLLLDAGKGFLAVWLAWRFLPLGAPLAALGAVLGHCFPVWLKFRGGKGVATTLGVALGLAWPVGLAYAGVWLAMLALTRISSLSGMAAAAAAPLAAALLGLTALVPVLTAIAVVIVYLHRENLARLRAGTEPKVGSKSQ